MANQHNEKKICNKCYSHYLRYKRTPHKSRTKALRIILVNGKRL